MEHLWTTVGLVSALVLVFSVTIKLQSIDIAEAMKRETLLRQEVTALTQSVKALEAEQIDLKHKLVHAGLERDIGEAIETEIPNSVLLQLQTISDRHILKCLISNVDVLLRLPIEASEIILAGSPAVEYSRKPTSCDDGNEFCTVSRKGERQLLNTPLSETVEISELVTEGGTWFNWVGPNETVGGSSSSEKDNVYVVERKRSLKSVLETITRENAEDQLRAVRRALLEPADA